MGEDAKLEALERRVAELERDPVAVPRRARADEELRRLREERASVVAGLDSMRERLTSLEEGKIPTAKSEAEAAGETLRAAETERNAAEDRLRKLVDEAGLLRRSALEASNRLTGLDETVRAVGGVEMIRRGDVG